ncbi:MAG: NYN domain-containing protein [Lachnospiraceae bacterium]
MDKRFALLIDADNVSSKYIKLIFDELSKYGNVTYKRIYGDWTSTQHASWKTVLLQNSISPIQQFSYTQGKNATDSAMIIDAMDILYKGNVDGFCLVSSDSDFTRLASRLRETGLTVIGMGEEKTPPPFRKACDIFTSLELLLEDSALSKEEDKTASSPLTPQEEVGHSKAASGVISKKEIEEAIVSIITTNENSDRNTTLGEVGNRLLKLYPDFDVRRYGYSLLSKFLEKLDRIKISKHENNLYVELKEDMSQKEKLEQYIIAKVKENGEDGIDLAYLGNMVKSKFSNFQVRDYGYSQFNQYVGNISSIQIVEGDKTMRAKYKK